MRLLLPRRKKPVSERSLIGFPFDECLTLHSVISRIPETPRLACGLLA
jgi:hypothetical protein